MASGARRLKLQRGIDCVIYMPLSHFMSGAKSDGCNWAFSSGMIDCKVGTIEVLNIGAFYSCDLNACRLFVYFLKHFEISY